MSGSEVAILLPTYGRKDRLADVVENAVVSSDRLTVYLLMEPDEADDYPPAVTMTRPEGFGNYAVAINYGYRETTEPYLFAAADDLNFHPGWLEAAMAKMVDEIQVVGTNDLGNVEVLAGEHSTHYLVDRRYLDDIGGCYDLGPGSFMPEVYDHNWTDREFVATATKRGVWTPCLESKVEHMHYLFQKASFDQTYARSFANENEDRDIYRQRVREIAEGAA